MGWNAETRRASAETRRQRQAERDRQVGPRIQALRAKGASWHVVAEKLNTEGLRAPRGGAWQAHQVFRVAQRIEEMEQFSISEGKNSGEARWLTRLLSSLPIFTASAASVVAAVVVFNVAAVYAGWKEVRGQQRELVAMESELERVQGELERVRRRMEGLEYQNRMDVEMRVERNNTEIDGVVICGLAWWGSHKPTVEQKTEQGEYLSLTQIGWGTFQHVELSETRPCSKDEKDEDDDLRPILFLPDADFHRLRAEYGDVKTNDEDELFVLVSREREKPKEEPEG